MGQYTPAARVWVGIVAVAALVVAARSLGSYDATAGDWPVLGLFALCAATAHVFPIRSAVDGATYRMTNAFIIAGAIVLPHALLPLLPVL